MCEHKNQVIEDGQHVCIMCGSVLGPHLSPTITSFNHPYGPARPCYSRSSRFRKIMLRIQGRTGHAIEEALMIHVYTMKPKSVEELFLVMKRWTGNTKPKPYESLPSIWYYCSAERPVPLEFWEERMLMFMFNLYDCRARDDGYSKTPPYAFLLRSFLEEDVMRLERARLQRITRFLPFMKCKWRLKYYLKQYAHVRRVFDQQKSSSHKRNTDEADRGSRGILCQQAGHGVTASEEQIQKTRVETTESLLRQKRRGGLSDTVQSRNRKTDLSQSGPTGVGDIWKTEAI